MSWPVDARLAAARKGHMCETSPSLFLNGCVGNLPSVHVGNKCMDVVAHQVELLAVPPERPDHAGRTGTIAASAQRRGAVRSVLVPMASHQDSKRARGTPRKRRSSSDSRRGTVSTRVASLR